MANDTKEQSKPDRPQPGKAAGDQQACERKDHKHAHEHAWKGSWDRPVEVDEESLDALTVARMTDHNVRGRAEEDDEKDPRKVLKPAPEQAPKTGTK